MLELNKLTLKELSRKLQQLSESAGKQQLKPDAILKPCKVNASLSTLSSNSRDLTSQSPREGKKKEQTWDQYLSATKRQTKNDMKLDIHYRSQKKKDIKQLKNACLFYKNTLKSLMDDLDQNNFQSSFQSNSTNASITEDNLRRSKKLSPMKAEKVINEIDCSQEEDIWNQWYPRDQVTSEQYLQPELDWSQASQQWKQPQQQLSYERVKAPKVQLKSCRA